MQKPRATGWIIGSAALHLALLAVPLVPPGTWDEARSTLEVTLERGADTGAVPPARVAPPKQVTKTTHASPVAVNNSPEDTSIPAQDADLATAEIAAHEMPVPGSSASEGSAERQPEAEGPASAIETAPTERGINFALAIAYLRDLIEQSKVYPRLARQRGWEGEVLLAFRIVDDGSIRGVHVARSSGNRLLDQSALKTLQGIERVTPEVWQNGEHAELQLSVVYRLIKS